MPLVQIKGISGYLSLQQKQELIRKVTDAIVSVEGEGLRPMIRVLVEDVTSGEWEETVVPLFLRKIFPDILLEKSAKITRPLMPSAAPIRPPRRVSTQRRTGHRVNDSTLPASPGCIFSPQTAPGKTPVAIGLSGTNGTSFSRLRFEALCAVSGGWALCRT